MNVKYEGRFLTIKSTGILGRIQHVKTMRGLSGLMYKFIVLDQEQKMHELMPHEVNLLPEDYSQEPIIEDEEATD